MVSTCATNYTMREISKFKLDPHLLGMICKTLFLSDLFRWQIEEEDVEEVGRTTTHYHRPLTNKPS